MRREGIPSLRSGGPCTWSNAYASRRNFDRRNLTDAERPRKKKGTKRLKKKGFVAVQAAVGTLFTGSRRKRKKGGEKRDPSGPAAADLDELL